MLIKKTTTKQVTTVETVRITAFFDDDKSEFDKQQEHLLDNGYRYVSSSKAGNDVSVTLEQRTTINVE